MRFPQRRHISGRLFRCRMSDPVRRSSPRCPPPRCPRPRASMPRRGEGRPQSRGRGIFPGKSTGFGDDVPDVTIDTVPMVHAGGLPYRCPADAWRFFPGTADICRTRYQHIPNTSLLSCWVLFRLRSRTEGGGRTGFPFRRRPYGVLQGPCEEGSVMLRRFPDSVAAYVAMPFPASCGILPFGVFTKRTMS